MTQFVDQDQRILDLLRRDPAEGVRELLDVFGPRVKGALLRKFKGKEESRIDAAVNEAAFQMSRRVDAFEASGKLGGYFLIAAKNILVTELRRAAVDHQLLSPGLLGALPGREDSTQDPSSRDRSLLVEVLSCVHQLPDQQQQIVLADLRRGSKTPAAELAAQLGTKASVIYVSRNKAHKKLRQLLTEHGRTFQ